MSAEATFTLGLWGLRLLFLLLVYLLLFQGIGALQRALAKAPVAERALAFLVIADPGGGPLRPGQRFPLQALNAVGRDPGNDVVLHDDFCSARHALVTYDGAQWWVEDAGSTNGTFVNGARADRSLPVHFGDEVEFGRVRLRLERT